MFKSGNVPKIKIPWVTIVRIIGFDLPDFIHDLQQAKAADSPGGSRITMDELKDILYDHFIKEIIPEIAKAMAEKNNIRR